MPALISFDGDKRSIIYDATEEDEPIGILFTYVSLMPVEIDRIKQGTSEEVQQVLKRYI